MNATNLSCGCVRAVAKSVSVISDDAVLLTANRLPVLLTTVIKLI